MAQSAKPQPYKHGDLSLNSKYQGKKLGIQVYLLPGAMGKDAGSLASWCSWIARIQGQWQTMSEIKVENDRGQHQTPTSAFHTHM